MQSEGLNPSLSHEAESCSPNIENLLQKAEFENSEQVKLIEAENQRYAALQRQLEEKTRRIEELDKSTKQLDEEAKMLHKHFKQNREICESLKKTNDILNEHEEAIQRKTEDLRCKTQQQEMQHQKILEKYRNTWQRYHEKYESGKSATELRNTKEKAQKLKEQARTMTDKIGDLKEGICKIEMEKNELSKAKHYTSAVPALLKLAELYLDGRKKVRDVNNVNNKIRCAEENQMMSSYDNEVTKEDNQMACNPPESGTTAVTAQEMPGIRSLDNTGISTIQSVTSPTPTWNHLQPNTTPSPQEKLLHKSPATASVNQEKLTVHRTPLQSSEKTPISSGQYPLRPTGESVDQSSTSKHTESPESFADISATSTVHNMDTSAAHIAASNAPDFSSPLFQLQGQLTQQVPRDGKEKEMITAARTAPQDQPENNTEQIGVQIPVSPDEHIGVQSPVYSPFNRTVDANKSPFSFAVHSQRVEQLTKSPGEGFLFRGRPMFGGREDPGKSNEPMPGFFHSFLESSQQGQTTGFGSSGAPVSSPSAQNESRSPGEITGFFSGSNTSSTSLFGSSFENQANSGPTPALFQMFDQPMSSENQPSSSQQSSSTFSLNFGSASPGSEDPSRPVFSFF